MTQAGGAAMDAGTERRVGEVWGSKLLKLSLLKETSDFSLANSFDVLGSKTSQITYLLRFGGANG